MTAAEGDELMRLAIEGLQQAKKISILLEGDPSWLSVMTLEHYGDPSAGGLFLARVMTSSGGYARLLARKDRIIAVQIL